MKIDPIEILLVEDNPADANLVSSRMKKARILNTLRIVNTGEQALRLLRQQDEYADAAVPDLILLDLNLPGIGGREVLRFVKESPALRHIPVVVLTSSAAETDIAKSYALHANAYVRKPLDLAGYRQIAAAINDFWLVLVRFDKRDKAASSDRSTESVPLEQS